MPTYRVNAGAPSEIYGQKLIENDPIVLSEAQALSLLMKGQIRLDATAEPVVPQNIPVRESDTITLRRDGVSKVVTIADLLDYLNGGPTSLELSVRVFEAGVSAGAILAAIVAPAGWSVTAETSFGGRVAVSGSSLVAAQNLSSPANGTARLRADDPDGTRSIIRTFPLEVKLPIGITMPTLLPITATFSQGAPSGAVIVDLPTRLFGEIREFVPNDGRIVVDANGDLVRGNAVVSAGTIAGTLRRTLGIITLETAVTLTVTAVADVTAPVITTPVLFTVAENLPLVIPLAASEPATFAKVGGADAALFTLDPVLNTLTLAPKDFDVAGDSDGNNSYVVQIRATDAAGNASTQTITVNVTNVLEGVRAVLQPASALMAPNAAAGTKLFDLPPPVEGESRAVNVSWLSLDASGDVVRNAMAAPTFGSVGAFPVTVTSSRAGEADTTVTLTVAVPIDVTVANAAALVTAAQGALGGGTVRLQSGTHTLALTDIAPLGLLTLTSADPGNRAAIVSASCLRCGNVMLDAMAINSAASGKGAAVGDVHFDTSSGIVGVSNSRILGKATLYDDGTVQKGYDAIRVVNGAGEVRITGNEISHGRFGVQLQTGRVEKLVLTGNDMHHMQADAWQVLSALGEVVATDNWFHDWLASKQSVNHTDIGGQVATNYAGTDAPPKVTYARNIADNGNGGWTQGLIFGQEGARRYAGGMVIEDNIIVVNAFTAVSIDTVDGAVVRNNIVARAVNALHLDDVSDNLAGQAGQKPASIRILGNSTGVLLENNVAEEFVITNPAGVTQSGNVVSSQDPFAPTFIERYLPGLNARTRDTTVKFANLPDTPQAPRHLKQAGRTMAALAANTRYNLVQGGTDSFVLAAAGVSKVAAADGSKAIRINRGTTQAPANNFTGFHFGAAARIPEDGDYRIRMKIESWAAGRVQFRRGTDDTVAGATGGTVIKPDFNMGANGEFSTVFYGLRAGEIISVKPIVEAGQTTGAWDMVCSGFELQSQSNPGYTPAATPDTTAPTIGTASSFTVPEGEALVVQLTANEAVTWTKTGGADASAWTLDTAASPPTITLAPKDFEAPVDVGSDNTYAVQVTATDAAGNAGNKTITATVTNVLEGNRASLTPTSITLSNGTAAGMVLADWATKAEGETRTVDVDWLAINTDGDLVRGAGALPAGRTLTAHVTQPSRKAGESDVVTTLTVTNTSVATIETIWRQPIARRSAKGVSSGIVPNVVASPADGSARAAYDAFLGQTASSETSDPAIVAASGGVPQHLTNDGADSLQVKPISTFLRNLSNGQSWSFVTVLKRPSGGWPVVQSGAPTVTLLQCGSNTASQAGLVARYIGATGVVRINTTDGTTQAALNFDAAALPDVPYVAVGLVIDDAAKKAKLFVNSAAPVSTKDYTLASATWRQGVALDTLPALSFSAFFAGSGFLDEAMCSVAITDAEFVAYKDMIEAELGIDVF